MSFRSLVIAGFAALSLVAPVAAASIDLPREAKKIIEDLEVIGGRPIAILTRVDNDPGQFWYKAMQALCEATGDNWCEDEVRFLTDTTNQIGWSRVFNYVNKDGVEKSACALLPPRPGLYPGYVASALSGGSFWAGEMPTKEETEAYLILLHAANCLNTSGTDQEQKRSDAFATMALTLIQGDADFVSAYDETPARLFNPMRNETVTRWATNVGERLLLELWKGETAEILRTIPCTVTVTASQDLNTDYIQRSHNLGGQDCQSSSGAGYRSGVVTDENLWVWASGGYGVSMPPAPYTPFKMFPDRLDGIRYIWGTAENLSKQ